MRSICLTLLATACVCTAASEAVAQSSANQDRRDAALSRLQAATGGAVVVGSHKSTGAARFVRLRPGARAALGRGRAATAPEKAQQSVAFFREYGALIGVSDAASMRLVSTATDRVGDTHLT
jgi:hypothetical protein